jgi:hypothetical protein
MGENRGADTKIYVTIETSHWILNGCYTSHLNTYIWIFRLTDKWWYNCLNHFTVSVAYNCNSAGFLTNIRMSDHILRPPLSRRELQRADHSVHPSRLYWAKVYNTRLGFLCIFLAGCMLLNLHMFFAWTSCSFHDFMVMKKPLDLSISCLVAAASNMATFFFTQIKVK